MYIFVFSVFLLIAFIHCCCYCFQQDDDIDGNPLSDPDVDGVPMEDDNEDIDGVPSELCNVCSEC